MDVIMVDGYEMEVVEITYRKKTTEISFINVINAESITREELNKAACCNLSESFETNPSVDVSYSNAITGTKQIQMLGLAGPYVQITRELIPEVRGINNIYGLNSIPGPWIQSIQLIKGTGSVVNGFESITGQINTELKKPDKEEVFHINGFINNGGRIELNSNVRTNLTDKISTGLLLHGKVLRHAHDRNDDGFTDLPTENNFIIANRWKFKHPSPADLFRTMEDASGVDLDWFWRGWFYTDDHVDMSIASVNYFKAGAQDPDEASEIQKAARGLPDIAQIRNEAEIQERPTESQK